LWSSCPRREARFTRADLLRELARHVDDPLWLSTAVEKALASPNVARASDGPPPRFTTVDLLKAEADLAAATRQMSRSREFGVASEHRSAAVQAQNSEMRRAFGGQLSQ